MSTVTQRAAALIATASSAIRISLRATSRRRLPLILFGAGLALVAISYCKSSSNNPMAPQPTASNGPLMGNLSNTGSQYAFTFTQAGSYAYFCTIHPTCASLTGTVVVVAANVRIQPQNHSLGINITGGSIGGPYMSGACSALSMPVDSVRVNDMVVWTNDSPLAHTVTSR